MSASVRRPGAFLALVPAVVYLIAVFYIGTLDSDPLAPVSFEFKDKILHALAFGLMQRTHYRAIDYLLPRLGEPRLSIVSATTACLVGILLELWQAILPHRVADPWDALANGCGAALFAWLFRSRTPAPPGEPARG